MLRIAFLLIALVFGLATEVSAQSQAPTTQSVERLVARFTGSERPQQLTRAGDPTIAQRCSQLYERCGNAGESCCPGQGLRCDCSSSECQCR
jgi:hypothetical protein